MLEAASFSRDNKIVSRVARIRRIMELSFTFLTAGKVSGAPNDGFS